MDIQEKQNVYDNASAIIATAKTLDQFYEAIVLLESLNGYKDSEEKIADCREQIKELKQKKQQERIIEQNILNEEEKKRKEKEKNDAAKKVAKRIKGVVLAIVIVTCVAFGIVLTTVVIPNTKYNEAVELYNSGNFDDAIISFTSLSGYKDSESQLEKCYIGKYGEEKYNQFKSIQIGDVYKFGKFEQDNNKSNGRENIEWIVLDKDGMSILLISKYALDSQPFNKSDSDTTWASCSLRKWLNGKFYHSAFSKDEQKRIVETEVSADRNFKYSTNPGSETKDKVFLLSTKEANEYFGSDSSRQCKGTEYCLEQEPYGIDSNCDWWLRTPGAYSFVAAAVGDEGSVSGDGYSVSEDDVTVRPAIWIDLSK